MMIVERIIIAAIFASIVTFTPIIPWLVEDVLMVNEDPLHTMLLRGLTGVTMYLISSYVLSGIKPRNNQVKIGKRKINAYGILAGIIIIGTAWFTDISTYILTILHLQKFCIKLYVWTIDMHFILIRLLIGLMTFVGVYIIKHSIKRELPKVAEAEYIPLEEIEDW